MDLESLQRPENEAVLAYLEIEQLPSWRESRSPWVVEGYSLSTHPDLCERVDEINVAAGGPATFRFLYGRPALIATNGLVVAFAGGTHIFCARLPRGECDAELVVTHVVELSDNPLVRQKQLQLEALLAGDWTRLDPWTVAVPKAEGLEHLTDHLRRATARIA